ncbi:hypothetical protein PRECH8_02210 [Insulibacter thermoxylanivorax]|uniref:Cell wall elongation regulator TseB-like domain-containing protein n=1 Tax=Insulibacter thermoxylanivorax TaxID=2749268 RepID=A0A916QA04_9BACL|nr:DUF5590 domain-containing protein [Insulibacter thermoxylanivorax]GFR36925.1 hypothetical protein PRECH8_02210 [Insulibacter thermoxylanivorax]
MARSRLEEWREESRRRTIRAAIISSVTLVLLALFLLHRWYVSIHASYWEQRDMSVSEAVYAGQLIEVWSSETYNGEQPWFIIQGMDEEGQAKIVWVSEEQTIVKPLEEGITEDETRRIVLNSSPLASIIRVTPGVWQDELCYEVYYKVPHPDGEIYYYAYIRFEDGKLIETLRLGR